jgi:predicted DCC family thiol-disulfide oxidoreductase YuxK
MNSSGPEMQSQLLTSRMHTAENSVCIFDGDCGICHKSVTLAQRLGSTCAFIPFQRSDKLPTGVTRERCAQEVVFVNDHGVIFGGAAAVAQVLRTSKVPVLGKVMDAPLILPISQKVYRFVARNRSRIPVRGYCST